MSPKFGRLDRQNKMAQIVEAGLGKPVNPKICEALVGLQNELQARQLELAQLLAAHEITAEEYLSGLDSAMKAVSVDGEKILGSSEAFHKIFGEFRAHNLGDVNRFVASYSLGRAPR